MTIRKLLMQHYQDFAQSIKPFEQDTILLPEMKAESMRAILLDLMCQHEINERWRPEAVDAYNPEPSKSTLASVTYTIKPDAAVSRIDITRLFQFTFKMPRIRRITKAAFHISPSSQDSVGYALATVSSGEPWRSLEGAGAIYNNWAVFLETTRPFENERLGLSTFKRKTFNTFGDTIIAANLLL